MKSNERLRRTVALLLVLVSAACADRLPGAQERVDLPGGDRPLTLQVEEIYRRGGDRAAGWEAFQRIRGLGFDGRGVLHVLDQGATTVTRIDPSGALLGQVGRRGGGPGELTAATGLAVAIDGTFAVYDLGRRSYALFDADGSYTGNHRADAGKGRIGDFALAGGEVIVGLPRLAWAGRVGTDVVTPTIPVEGGELLDPPGLPLLRATLGGGEPAVLRWTWIAPLLGGSIERTAFRPRPHWALLPDGRVAVADSLDWTVHVVGGERAVVWRRPLEARPPSRSERREELERRTREAEEGGGGAAAGVGRSREGVDAARRARRERLDQELQFYPELQVIRGLRADPEGQLWIERVGRDVAVPGPVDVVDPQGRYLGTVAEGSFSLPDALGPGGLAVWLERDALDSPVVTVRRIRTDGGAS